MTTRIDQDLELARAPVTVLVTDCRGLFDAVNRCQSAGLGLPEKRRALEALSIRQICSLSKITTKWVNSDSQIADMLTNTKRGI
eukprot:7656049-Lingulodinium_polyedra.AAC.1